VGVKAVIAQSFAFIYQRNQPSLGLLGFVIDNDRFYELAQDGEQISIDIPARKVSVASEEFPFQLSEIEYNLMENKGIAQSFQKYGKRIWTEMMASGPAPESVSIEPDSAPVDGRLNW
jgi:3-isopropylmalate dehydratase small subunit